MHKQFWSNIEITKCCGYLECGEKSTGSEDRAQKRLILQLKDGHLDNEVKVTKIISTLYFAKMI